jgi:hypothetical protein
MNFAILCETIVKGMSSLACEVRLLAMHSTVALGGAFNCWICLPLENYKTLSTGISSGLFISVNMQDLLGDILVEGPGAQMLSCAPHAEEPLSKFVCGNFVLHS